MCRYTEPQSAPPALDCYGSVASRFAEHGLVRLPAALPSRWRQFLNVELIRLRARIPVPRPWHYAELHNPWSRAAAFVDSWGFLDLCQIPALLDTATVLLGPDLILFDSQLLPEPWVEVDTAQPLHSDAHHFIVEPAAGLTALIGLNSPSTLRFEPFLRLAGDQEPRQSAVAIEPSDVLFIDPHLPYQVTSDDGESAGVLAVRYYPGSSCYLRDPSIQRHRELTERYPFINYARLPLWLVRGSDRAGNDFVTGFATRAGYWTSAAW